MGRTFHSLSWVRVGSNGEEDDVRGDDVHGDDVHGDDDGGWVVVKCRYLQMARKRSLVIRYAMGR